MRGAILQDHAVALMGGSHSEALTWQMLRPFWSLVQEPKKGLKSYIKNLCPNPLVFNVRSEDINASLRNCLVVQDDCGSFRTSRIPEHVSLDITLLTILNSESPEDRIAFSTQYASTS